MEDVLALLNFKQSYKERKNEIAKYLNKQNTNYKILHLTVASTTLNYSQKIFSISPSGMLHSNYINNDGIVLFGYENYENENVNTVNDFIFPTNNNLDKTKNGYEFPNFAIYFDTKDENYYIKDLNTGVGALMKIKKYKLENNTLINIGSNYIVIGFDTNFLTLKIFNNLILENESNGGENCSSQKFKIEKSKNFKITIGRSQKCDVSIGDMMLSKIQSCIEYNAKENQFYLLDGNEEKESTNGTWVYIVNPVQITNDFLFKAEHTLFIANLTKN